MTKEIPNQQIFTPENLGIQVAPEYIGRTIIVAGILDHRGIFNFSPRYMHWLTVEWGGNDIVIGPDGAGSALSVRWNGDGIPDMWDGLEKQIPAEHAGADFKFEIDPLIKEALGDFE